MRIGTIGAGEVALGVAREALAQGHEIVLSSRSGPGALAGKVTELGRGALAGTVEEAASTEIPKYQYIDNDLASLTRCGMKRRGNEKGGIRWLHLAGGLHCRRMRRSANVCWRFLGHAQSPG